MDRKTIFSLIAILTLIVFCTGLLSAQAEPFAQEETTAAESETPEEEAAGDIELIQRETEPAEGEISPAENDETEAEPAETAEPPEPPTAPLPEAPTGSVPSKEIGFYWTPSANAEHYEVVYGNDRGVEEVRLELSAEDWTCLAGRCILYEELPSDGSYTWKVSAVNESGTATSEEITFSVKYGLSSSEAYSPATVLSNTKPLSFQWGDAGSDASSFRIQVLNRDSGLISLDKWYGRDQISYVNGFYVLDSGEFLPSGSYAWRVQGRNDTHSSDWSSWREFGINCAECDLGTYLNTETAVLSPNGTISDPQQPFVWKTVMGAAKYQLEIKHSDGTELLVTDVAPEVCGVEVCSYKPELDFKPGESYEWTLLTYGWNNIFWGSDNKTFSVAALPESGGVNIEFVGPENNASLDPDNQQIIWTDPGTQTANFRIGVSDSEGNWLLVSDLTREDAWCDGLTCSVQFFTIPEGDNYQFTLVPYDEYNTPGEPVSLTFNNIGTADGE